MRFHKQIRVNSCAVNSAVNAIKWAGNNIPGAKVEKEILKKYKAGSDFISVELQAKIYVDLFNKYKNITLVDEDLLFTLDKIMYSIEYILDSTNRAAILDFPVSIAEDYCHSILVFSNEKHQLFAVNHLAGKVVQEISYKDLKYFLHPVTLNDGNILYSYAHFLKKTWQT